MSESAITSASVLGSLSGAGLLGLMVLSLAIQKVTLDTYKENNKTMMDFIREHCKNTNDELKRANDKLDKIDDDLDALKEVGVWFKDLNGVKK